MSYAFSLQTKLGESHPPMTSENFRLDREIDAARLLLSSLADIIAGDEAFAADVVLGQTNLVESIQSACALYCADKTSVEAIDAHIKLMEARKHRLKKRMDMTRTLVTTAMEVAGRKSVETPLGTATLKTMPRALRLDEEREADIPSEYWKRADPVLDKKKLKEALEEGKIIPGATLDNGGISLSFTFR